MPSSLPTEAQASSSPAASLGRKPHPATVTGRSIALGVLGAAQVVFIQVSTEVKATIIIPPYVNEPYPSWYAVLPGAIFWLFLVAVLNGILKRWRPRAALRPAEFALIFGMTTTAAAIGAFDELMNLFPTYMYPFSASQADSMASFRQYLPAWMVPHAPAVIPPYYHGHATFWTRERLGAWLLPLCCWTTYAFALGATMWGWNVILRRRWIDNDRLAFPNVQVPVEMCRAAGFGGLLSGKLFWGGMLTAAFLESCAHLHQRYPQVPMVPLSIDLDGLLTALSPPWNVLAPMQVLWNTVHLGIAYFIPLDILFSASFFFLFRKGMEVFGRSMGWRDLGWDANGFPFSRSQGAGAWVALFFLLLWAERHHLRRVLTAAFSRRSELMRDADEPGSYRWAGRILVGGTLFLILFSVAGGMSPVVAVAFYGLFWMLNVTATRVYAQVGPPTLELYFLDPQRTLTTAFGSSLLSNASAFHLALLTWLTRTNSGHPMAHQLSAFYVAKETEAPMRRVGKGILLALLVGIVTCLLTYLHYAYRVGEDQFQEGGWHAGSAVMAVGRTTAWTSSPKGPQGVEISYMFVGAIITLLLSKATFTFIGFPLHPVGFGLAMCFGVEYTWATFLAMWIFKGLLLRYGGRRVYQAFAPFFLGLALGGVVTPVSWGMIAWALGWYR